LNLNQPQSCNEQQEKGERTNHIQYPILFPFVKHDVVLMAAKQAMNITNG
jgi:hypothetical protein